MQVSSMVPVFKLDLGHKVLPAIVTVGKYDGTHPCLTAATGFDKVIIHSPYGSYVKAERSTVNSDVYELNLNQEITCLATGPIRPDAQRDVLLIGSPSQILAYDVHENTDIFFKDIEDGVNVIAVGVFGKQKELVAVVGGNSSFRGLKNDGTELFWSTVGGKVNTVIFFDFDRDGSNELLVGCEDALIRIFKNDQIIAEISETGPVTFLAESDHGRFAYGVSNGTIGVYEEALRIWRVKSKQNSNSLQWTGEAIAVIWSNGRIDWREPNSGEVLKRYQMKGEAAAMMLVDYRTVGTPDLICVSCIGEVIGFPPYESKSQNKSELSSKSDKQSSETERKAIMELFGKKQALLVELQHYESNMMVANSIQSMDEDRFDKPNNALPANTRLQVALAVSAKESCVELEISTNNNTLIRAAVILAEAIFPDGRETLSAHPPSSQLKSSIRMTFEPVNDISVDMHIKALIGYQQSEQYHVFELTKTLPRFAMYSLLTEGVSKDEDCGHVIFKVKERLQRICIWINQNFLLENEIELESEFTKELHVPILCLRNHQRLDLHFEADGTVKFETSSIKLAADLVQSLANYLNLVDLETNAKFPVAEAELRNEMNRSNLLAETRSRLAAITAERAQIITVLLPAAADIAYDLKEMLSKYHEVVLLNEELVAGCHGRRSNHTDSIKSVQSIHKIIQHASRLRAGKFSKQVIVASRKAIQDGNTEALLKIICVGNA